MTFAEQLKEIGRQEGVLEALKEILRLQLSTRFGELPPHVLLRLQENSEEQLRSLSLRLLDASSLDELFA